MTQTQLDQAVARITGDDLDVIQSRGFSLLQPNDEPNDGLLEKHLDWDDLEGREAR